MLHFFFRFDMEAPDFFNTSVRITVVSYILEREQFGKHCHDKGIKRLLSENIYKAAYPLHDVSIILCIRIEISTKHSFHFSLFEYVFIILLTVCEIFFLKLKKYV